MDNINKVVYLLREQGHSVETYRRPDGGVRITAIDGMRFAKSGAEGNNLGRSMTGTFMSKAQTIQRKRANRAVIRFTAKQKKIIQKAQRQVKKASKKQGDTYRLKAKAIKQNIKRVGWKAALKTIKNVLRHKLGGAYEAETEWWAEMLDQNNMPATAEWIRAHPSRVSWQAINTIHDLFYAAYHGQITYDQADAQALAYLRNKKNWFKG